MNQKIVTTTNGEMAITVPDLISPSRVKISLMKNKREARTCSMKEVATMNSTSLMMMTIMSSPLKESKLATINNSNNNSK
jgi:hypothetical protein